ncbi:hypothetical protein M3M38_00040 [Fructilactobacillus cliffordii]|uniref:hypothetical protein n=1 Tax=Fructilactobacillus cliffordii TaxID=2940299 RepID=UPI0020932CF6|nr:hypothetical protein [Fructilactobacillus cliffordii]USS86506.1 hypothetical protein M3M38_00040 [Fructilactobacillus cliffordii]
MEFYAKTEKDTYALLAISKTPADGFETVDVDDKWAAWCSNDHLADWSYIYGIPKGVLVPIHPQDVEAKIAAANSAGKPQESDSEVQSKDVESALQASGNNTVEIMMIKTRLNAIETQLSQNGTSSEVTNGPQTVEKGGVK